MCTCDTGYQQQLKVSMRQINPVQCTDQKCIPSYVSLYGWRQCMCGGHIGWIPGFVCDVCGLSILGVSAGHVRDDPGRS